ncbi:hypothetical protein [Microbacterium sp. PAMC22086]|uniref:hypothetical protein n=1 Tax=Microbacterium sp. PAMC22086 TaxID=2861281 RepID=UPI002159B02C|nr:hypothetical protein [Microbacterium sp. PAMC22086]
MAGLRVDPESLRVGIDVEAAAVSERRMPLHSALGDVDQGDGVGGDRQQRSRSYRGATADADAQVDRTEHVRERVRIHCHHAFGNVVARRAIPPSAPSMCETGRVVLADSTIRLIRRG